MQNFVIARKRLVAERSVRQCAACGLSTEEYKLYTRRNKLKLEVLVT